MSNSLVKVKFFSATNTRGSRLKATHVDTGKSLTKPYNHRLNPQENKIKLVGEFVEANPNLFNQNSSWVYQETKDGCYFIATDHPIRF